VIIWSRSVVERVLLSSKAKEAIARSVKHGPLAGSVAHKIVPVPRKQKRSRY